MDILKITANDNFEPINAEEFLVSQSALKGFFDKDLCQIRWYRQFHLKHEYPSSELMMKGKYFEYHTIGGIRDGEDPPEPERKSNGEPYKSWQDLMDLVERVKVVLHNLKIKIHEVQPEWISGNLLAHPDFIGEFNHSMHMSEFDDPMIIGDVKYTETRRDDRWNGWAEIESRPLLWVQPLHYVHTYRIVTGKILPFYYFIFGKAGWVIIYRIRMRQETLLSHISSITTLQQKLPGFFPKPAGDYNKCTSCGFYDTCMVRTDQPNITDVII